MDSEFLFIALALISVLSSLATEGIKKLLNERQVKYSANIIAVVVSVVLTVGSSICYIIYNEIAFSPKIGVEIVVLVFLSFLTSTVGYDKVLQAITQIKRID